MYSVHVHAHVQDRHAGSTEQMGIGQARRWPYFQNRCGEAPEVSGKVAPCWCHYVHRELQDSAARATLHVLRQLIHMPCIVKLLFA